MTSYGLQLSIHRGGYSDQKRSEGSIRSHGDGRVKLQTDFIDHKVRSLSTGTYSGPSFEGEISVVSGSVEPESFVFVAVSTSSRTYGLDAITFSS